MKVLLIEGNDVVSAVCLDINIASQGKTKKEAVEELATTMARTIALGRGPSGPLSLGIDELRKIPRAPDKYWVMYDGSDEYYDFPDLQCRVVKDWYS